MKTFVIDSPRIILEREGVEYPLFFCGFGAAVAVVVVVFGITFFAVATV